MPLTITALPTRLYDGTCNLNDSPPCSGRLTIGCCPEYQNIQSIIPNTLWNSTYSESYGMWDTNSYASADAAYNADYLACSLG